VYDKNGDLDIAKLIMAAGSTFVLITLLCFCVGFIHRGYDRQQTLWDEQNQVQVNDIRIQQTVQLVQVEKQKALIKVQEAMGISQAQKIINGTLTPQYLQHEAIQAQLTAAENSSHTETIYVPSGPQGIPMVFQPGQK
jgi:hypothetical protein